MAVTPCPDGRLADLLADGVLLRVPELTDALVGAIQESNPGYRTVDVVPVTDLWRSCHDNITRVLQLISRADGPPLDHDHACYDAARATGRRRAEQGLPLDDVLRSFRIGGRLVWEALLDQARVGGALDSAALLDVATRVWEVVDATSAQVAAAYHATERRLVRADEQRRAALWEGLLQGRAHDPAFAHEAATILELAADGACAVVVAAGAGTVGLGGLRSRLRDAGIASAWQLRGETLVGLLGLPDGAALAVAAPVLARNVPGPAGISTAVAGLRDAASAYRQAVLARQTVPPGSCDVVTLDERLPEALLLSSPELAERLAQLWLAPLLALPAPERRLLQATLEAWLGTERSPSRTAVAVHCHRNTVLNRIRRIGEVVGRDLTTAPVPVELVLALRAGALLTGA